MYAAQLSRFYQQLLSHRLPMNHTDDYITGNLIGEIILMIGVLLILLLQ